MNNFYDKYDLFPLSILDTPIENAEDEIYQIIEKWWGTMKIERCKVDLDKVNLPPLLQHGSAHFTKILIWEPKNNPDKTALFVNLRDAYDSLISIWNERFAKWAVTVKMSNDEIAEYPHHEMKIRTAAKEERVIYTHVESKWSFFQTGPLQDFENPEYYKAKRIKDRLDNAIINDYMQKMGFNIWSEEFYTSGKKAVYFEELSCQK